jgi:5-methylcytosine-specific restriction endonuclease McrA
MKEKGFYYWIYRHRRRNGVNQGNFDRLVRLYGYHCNQCYKVPIMSLLTVDHILGKWPGKYRNNISNLQLLCEPCHRFKDNIGAS